MDSCLICLEECGNYLRLSLCECKNIIHEGCFKKYVKNSGKVKCLICNKVKDFSPKKCDTLLDSIFYTLFFMLQNIYFYIDEKYFPKNDLTFGRIFSVMLFHVFLTLILVLPWAIITYIKYAIHTSMLCNKPYKIYDL